MASVPVAIAHDYLTQRGGAERVVLALAKAFPEAPIYTTLYDPDGTYPEFRGLDIRTSWLNRLPLFRREHRAALPLMPAASSSINVDADVLIVSSSGWAHGFRTTGSKLVYCYSPARWLYEPDRYLGDQPNRAVAVALRVLGPVLRRWDRWAAATADQYLAISSVTQERIRKTYGLEVPVVPAPHSVRLMDRADNDGRSRLPEPGYHLVVSRLLPYKNVEPIVSSFVARPDRRLLIVGAGPQKEELRALATPNITFLEGLTDAEMADAYRGCEALVAASHEDFGLTPLEAAAYGKPSAVLRWGGFLDTVVEGETGVFFDRPDPDLIASALDELSTQKWDEERLRSRAAEFDETVFAQRIHEHVRRLSSDLKESTRD